MVFNILSNNTDDHNKNFSFVMNEDGSWRLAPAYDITYIIDRGGHLPNKEHCMYIRAKLYGITRADVIEFARDNGIRRPDAIIRDVVFSLKQFRPIAADNGVSESWIGRVESTIVEHLKAWGEWECETADIAMEINGHAICNVHIEQTYKGNYHLSANVDGAERKFVIGKSKEEFASIEQIGLSNLTPGQLKSMVAKYLL